MAKKYKIVPGKCYHIFNRGNNRRTIFYEDKNYHYFLKLADKYISRIGKIYAYALLPDHFHFVIRFYDAEELGERSIPQELSNYFNAYAKAFNKMYNEVSSVFEAPFERIPIESEDQFMRTISYVHWNPQKHRIVKDYRHSFYSSYHLFLTDAFEMISGDEVISFFGSKEEMFRFQDEFVTAQK